MTNLRKSFRPVFLRQAGLMNGKLHVISKDLIWGEIPWLRDELFRCQPIEAQILVLQVFLAIRVIPISFQD